MNPNEIINTSLAHPDKNGIWVSKSSLQKTDLNTLETWQGIYGFDDTKFIEDRENFFKNKLDDHLKYILPTYKFNSNTVYLEIGCGPSYIAEYLMKNFDVTFVGIDFNYNILLEIKKYFEKVGLKKFILIQADINEMPLNKNSIDFIYGAGVIEHISNTSGILKDIHKILKPNGVSFNTVPAFNLWWILRFYNNIPFTPVLRSFFEFFHIKLLNYSILKKFYGYELSYTKDLLLKLHSNAGFKNIHTDQFAISPSKKFSKNKLFVDIYMKLSNNSLTSPVYCVYGTK